MIKYCTLNLFFLKVLFFTILSAGLVTPPNNSELNYVHVLFEWDQVPGASSYNIEIAYDSQFNELIKERVGRDLDDYELRKIGSEIEGLIKLMLQKGQLSYNPDCRVMNYSMGLPKTNELL